MKEEFAYSGSYVKFAIFSHGSLFYLKHDKDSMTIAKADDIKILRAYIDAYIQGHSDGRARGSKND